ncbi:hypothetical protein RB595_007239 [Gaeumannomyces hyphopodioides]
MDDPAAQIRAALVAQSLPPPSHAWLQNLLSSRPRPLPPLPSLTATAKARLLAADLTAPGLLDPAGTAPFPPVAGAGAGGQVAQEVRLPRDVACQVLDVENLSRSRWDQVEELEAVARGELTRGRQVVRVRDADDDGGGGAGGDVPPEDRPGGVPAPAPAGVAARPGGAAPAPAADKNATHRLVLQDCRGQKLFGLELRRVERLGVGRTNIGEKILLRAGTAVARGTVLLEPDKCVVLGGKVEAWHKSWVDGRLARLKEAAGTPDRDSR